MTKTESKKWSQIAAVFFVLLVLFHRYIIALVKDAMEFLDTLFGVTTASTQVAMWVIGGALIGGIYGSAAAIKKYRLTQKEILLPAGALALFILISCLRH